MRPAGSHAGHRKRRRSRGPARLPDVPPDPAVLDDPIAVTDLAEDPRRPGRVALSLNGVPWGSVTLDCVADLGLRSSRLITRAAALELVQAVIRTTVLDKALDVLAVRARSVRDLRIRLRRAGAPEPAVAWVVDRLEAQGLIDDAAYARQVARARLVAGGVSRRLIVKTLRQRGVSGEIAEDAVEETMKDVGLDEEAAARSAAMKRLRTLASVDPMTRRKRLYAYLARRGYESSVVRRVLAEVLHPDSGGVGRPAR